MSQAAKGGRLVKQIVKSRWGWAIVGLLCLGILLQFGGTTIVVLNRAFEPICAVHVSDAPHSGPQGPNRLWSPLRYPHSRDLHLPLTMNLSRPAEQRAYYLWALDCDGQVMAETAFIGMDESLLFWEVTRP
jgi:hypothetical protein